MYLTISYSGLNFDSTYQDENLETYKSIKVLDEENQQLKVKSSYSKFALNADILQNKWGTTHFTKSRRSRDERKLILSKTKDLSSDYRKK